MSTIITAISPIWKVLLVGLVLGGGQPGALRPPGQPPLRRQGVEHGLRRRAPAQVTGADKE